MIVFKNYLRNNLLSNTLRIVLSLILVFITKEYTEKVKSSFDSIINTQNLDVFEKNIFMIVVFLVIMFLIMFYNTYLRSKAHWRGMENITVFLYYKILKKDYSYFVENKAPAINHDISALSMECANFYTSMFVLLSNIIESFFFTFILFSINQYAGVIGLVLIPIVVVSNIIIKKKLDMVIQNLMEIGRETGVVTNETLESANNIKVKNKVDYFIDRIVLCYKKIHKHSTENVFYVMVFEKMVNFTMYVGPALLILIVVNNDERVIELGELIALFTIIPLVMNGYNGVINGSLKCRIFKTHYSRVKKILDYKDECEDGIEINEFVSLSTEKLKITYKNGQIVAIPNLLIKKGEKVIISGESGIGKSTFFDIILRFKNNYEGSIRVNGIELKEISISCLRKIFGISFQNNEVIPMSLKENIILNSQNEEKYNSIVDLSGIEKLLITKGNESIISNTVSGGEKARIGLAQNLMNNPSVILLDESFSNLDEEIERRIMSKLVKEYKKETIICISHRISTKKYFEREIVF